ncbi:MAG: hypothetical protein AUF79_18405 [Crenarchaeota archaeon 13_1_20CM_2_51_8]|nr:MAG: hypothetical protein AUF79_18405 [Crenarchaeota archaeon 13_1_20CM_2_51_8]
MTIGLFSLPPAEHGFFSHYLHFNIMFDDRGMADEAYKEGLARNTESTKASNKTQNYPCFP